jgi:hypothetical protein
MLAVVGKVDVTPVSNAPLPMKYVAVKLEDIKTVPLTMTFPIS